MSKLLGRAKVTAKGLNIERFLNENITSGIPMQALSRHGYTCIDFSVPILKYRKLKKNAEKFDITLSTTFSGALSFIYGARQRLIFVGGLFVSLCVIIVMSGFILTVEIAGNETIDEYALRNSLLKCGVNNFVSKSMLDMGQIKNTLMLEYPQIAYVDCEVHGVVFRLEVIEGIAPPHIPDTAKPADIIALKDAYIQSVTARSGKAVVEKGQTVVAGQKLISGTMGEIGQEQRLYCAQGSVIGNIWYSGQASAPITGYVKTGNSFLYKTLYLGKTSLSPLPDVPYEKYRSVNSSEKVYFENLFLPLRVINENYFEVTIATRSERELTDGLSKIAFQRAMESVPKSAEILDVSFNYNIDENEVVAGCLIKTAEEIGTIRYMQ